MSSRAAVACVRSAPPVRHARPRPRSDADEDSRRPSLRLLAEVSHDLRTPLASLRLLVEGLRDGVLPDDRRAHYLTQMETQVSLLSAMIDDLHSLSRMHAGDLAPPHEPVDPRALIARAGEAMRIQAEARGVMLDLEASADLPSLCADAMQLHRVLVNLIENAIRHTDQGGRVAVRVRPAFGGVEIEIEDDGEGIPAEDRECVFRAFYGRDRERSPARSGLGLAMARATVEAHGGRIRLEDSARGAHLRIALPSAAQRRLHRRRGQF